MKRLASIAMSLVAMAAVTLGIARPAQADAASQPGTLAFNLLVNVRYGECLTVTNATPGSGVGHFVCDDIGQRWTLDSLGTVTVFGLTYSAVRLRNENSGLCADVAGNGYTSGTLIIQNYCNTLAQQTFFVILEASGGTFFYFANLWAYQRGGVIRVIDVPPHTQSSNVRLWTYNKSTAQQFAIL